MGKFSEVNELIGKLGGVQINSLHVHKFPNGLIISDVALRQAHDPVGYICQAFKEYESQRPGPVDCSFADKNGDVFHTAYQCMYVPETQVSFHKRFNLEAWEGDQALYVEEP
jgi:hypothetical protein